MPLIGPEGREQLKLAGQVGSVGLELVIATMIGYFAGRWLDGKLGTHPWLMYVGIAFGVAAGVKGLVRLGRKYGKKKEPPKSD